ncbi:hypothetical protein Dester_0069 [Desulfurobacterium thermolithotrophum DSM 11699]|uniref:Uncharacterized protein n=1 Tax=Desulfurobacterium thermolithotrophum (strain DSM 11699 / BSA) TaxID=868864 RepID=F0S0K0_DESTD|nr:hypothetical protein Dester_0069 [Desulfurobacterium thermolithotrophum DSM 11699]
MDAKLIELIIIFSLGLVSSLIFLYFVVKKL